MKNIGVIVAIEIESVLDKYGDELKEVKAGGFDVFELKRPNYNMYFVHSKLGLIRSAAAVQMLCDRFAIDFLINFGVVGSLTDDLKLGDTCFVSKVVHYGMDMSELDQSEAGKYEEYPNIYLSTSSEILSIVKRLYPEIPIVTAVSADKFVGDPNKKRDLHKKYEAEIVDMESASVVLISDINRIPNLLIKTVSNSSKGGAAEFNLNEEEAADMCIEIVDEIVESGQI